MKKIFSAIVATITLAACDNPGQEMIPEDDMKKIITDALVTDAILQSDRSQNGINYGLNTDTLDFYAPIVKRYGYTASDVRHTVSVMSSRKSNPLNNILSDVVKNIEQINQMAEYHYRAYLKFDTLATSYYRDTLYTNKKGVEGKMGKYQILIKDPKAGTYELKMNYFTSDDFRVRAKRILYTQSGGELKYDNNGSFYMSKVKEETPFRAAFELPQQGADSLLIKFQESFSDFGGKIQDTSYVHDITLIYMPLASHARDCYYKQITGLTKDIREDYEQKILSSPDSIAFPIVRFPRDTTQRGR